MKKNKTHQSTKKFFDNTKKAAAIMLIALGFTVVGQQAANAQELDFSSMQSKELEEIKKHNAELTKKNAELEKRNAEHLEIEKDLDAQLELLKAKKENKQSAETISQPKKAKKQGQK